MSRTTLTARVDDGASPPSGSISGTVQQGATLTLTGSGYTSLQWLHAGSPIAGETATTYVVDRADGVLDHGDITCEMTGPGGVTESNALVYEGADLPAAVFCFDYDVTIVSGGFDVISSAFGAVACTLTAASATQRPAASSGGIGGRALATLDGVDDVMTGVLTVGHARATYEEGAVGGRSATSATGDIILSYDNAGTARWAITDRTTTQIRWVVVGGANQDFTTDPDGITRHWSGDSAGGQQTARIDGAAVVGPTAATTTSRADGGNFNVGSGTVCAQFYFQALYDGDALTADQRTDLRTLLTGLSGHAC